MGGTIRCFNDGKVLDLLEISWKGSGITILQCQDCNRKVTVPSILYTNILRGANFTHVFFSSETDLRTYLKDHKERFQFIGNSHSQISEDLWHLIF